MCRCRETPKVSRSNAREQGPTAAERLAARKAMRDARVSAELQRKPDAK